MKKLAVLLLALCLTVGLALPAAAETPVTPISSLDLENPVINWADPLNSLMFGMFSDEVAMADGSTRTLYQYIPTTWRYGQPEVAVAVPSGSDPIAFFEETGWKDAAENGPFAVILMTADDWTDQDEYVAACYAYMNARANVYTLKVAFYMVGYGDAANQVVEFAVTNNDTLSGVAAFGVDNFDNSLLELGRTTDTAVAGLKKADMPTPIWLGVEEKTAEAEELISYWKEVAKVSDQQFSNAYADEVYFFPSYLSNTFEKTYQNIASVYVTEGLEDVYTPEFTNNLYFNFLGRVRRVYSLNNRPLSYYATTEELGFDHYEFTMHNEEKNVDVGREYWVYKPTHLPDKEVPVVFVAPGVNDSGEEFITITDWYKCAEERGFIYVQLMASRGNEKFKASTAWNPGDIEYFKQVRADVLANYNIDESRIYFTGHSNGSMFAHYISYVAPELIAAACGNDFLLTSDQVLERLDAYNLTPNYDVTIPFMVNTGTLDRYFEPTEGSGNCYDRMDQYFEEWRTRYGLSDTEFNFKNGNNFGTEYHNSQGIPLVKMQWNQDKVHCMDAEDPYIIYDFLCNFSRDENNTSYYMGVEIQLDK